jgi:hypothetical protein
MSVNERGVAKSLIEIASHLANRLQNSAAKVVPILADLVKDGRIPIDVDVDQRVPINFDQPIELPIVLQTEVDVDHEIDLEADIPVDTEIDMDTTVETKVLGLGSIKVPIKAKIPLKMVLPIKTKIRLVIDDFPISIDDKMNVQLPPMETPLKTTLKAKVRIL